MYKKKQKANHKPGPVHHPKMAVCHLSSPEVTLWIHRPTLQVKRAAQ